MNEKELEQLKLSYIEACADTVRLRYRSAIKPVYAVKRADEAPLFIGSCTFATDGVYKYCLTAAHVTDHLKEATLFVLHENFVALEGYLKSTEAPNGNRDKDYIDVAVLRLSEDAVKSLDGAYFIDVGLFVKEPLKANQKYASVLGYPLSKHKKPLRRWKSIKTYQYSYTDKIMDMSEFAANPEYSTSTHVLLHHNNQTSLDQDGRKVSSYGTIGVSGGGLFLIEPILGQEPIDTNEWKILFAGILVEKVEKVGILVFTNALVLLDIILEFDKDNPLKVILNEPLNL